MLSMKTKLAIFFKHYEVQSTEYKSIEDVDFWLNIIAYPKTSCKVKLQKLEKKNSFLNMKEEPEQFAESKIIIICMYLLYFCIYCTFRSYLIT
jgi:hypothetical protein